MQKGNRVRRSAYHDWHHLPPLQNHQSRCRKSRHGFRRADRLLGPCRRAFSSLSLKILVVLLFQLGQTLAEQSMLLPRPLTSAKDCIVLITLTCRPKAELRRAQLNGH